MNKWKILLPVLTVCLLGVTLYRLFIWPAPFTDQMRAEIPLTAQDGVRFGSSARAVAAAYGKPVETEKDTDSGRTHRSYRADILDSSADIRCGFAAGRLVEMVIRWELASAEDAQILCKSVEDMIQERCGRENGFWCEEAEEPNGDRSVKMGIDYGATGIYYTIKLSDSTLSVTCFDQY